MEDDGDDNDFMQYIIFTFSIFYLYMAPHKMLFFFNSKDGYFSYFSTKHMLRVLFRGPITEVLLMSTHVFVKEIRMNNFQATLLS